MGLLDRLSHAWNAFLGKGPPFDYTKSYFPRYYSLESGTSYRPDRVIFTRGQEKTFVNTMVNRIAVDSAAINIKHVKMDEEGRYSETVDSELNKRLSLEANKDQTGRAFIQDIVTSMLDEGCVAVVPIDYDDAADASRGPDAIDILSYRVGKIVQWYPDKIQVEVYNDRLGQKQMITVEKKAAAIIENPFYAIMNEPNSILQRLVKKLNLLDVIDAQSGSGKLNLIVQLPYVIKTQARKTQAENRLKDIEDQLQKSQYGIVYTDGTEKVTQLNRPAENNLLSQIQYLTSMLFSQLGLTESILNGTADESTMLNYQHRIIIPILSAITEEFNRKFLTDEEREDNQTVMFFVDPFKYVSVSDIAEISDKMTRNEILTPNEIRQIIGIKPSQDPKADELRNRNINQSNNEITVDQEENSANKKEAKKDLAKKTE